VRQLVDVEVRRYLSRRLARFLVGLAVLGILIAGTVMFIKSHRLNAAARASAIQRAEAQRVEAVNACSAGEFGVPPSEIPPGQTLAQFCEQLVGEPPIHDSFFHLTSLEDVYLGTNGILVTMFLLLGASFVGAEWHSGTMTTLLTWEPRRLRVLAAKIGVAAVLAFLGYVIIQAILGAALTPTAVFKGTTQGADGAWFLHVTGFVLRGAATAAIAATFGASLAAIGRNTAAALGVAFGYFAILEPLVRSLRPKWQPWLVVDNVATFVLGHGGGNAEFSSRSPLGAGILIGIYAVGLAAAAVALFRARDVT
jgi:ABC-2 type transport system permease protein